MMNKGIVHCMKNQNNFLLNCIKKVLRGGGVTFGGRKFGMDVTCPLKACSKTACTFSSYSSIL